MKKNKIEVGDLLFNVAGSDGKAKPTHYLLEVQGVVEVVDNSSPKLIKFKNMYVFGRMEDKFLKPSQDGFCYYFNGFEGIEEYKVDDRFYKVPADKLLKHMSTYESPWY